MLLYEHFILIVFAVLLLGMELVLYLQIEEYLKGITNGYGIRLVIHRPNSYPFPYDEGFFISAAMETHVALKMVSLFS